MFITVANRCKSSRAGSRASTLIDTTMDMICIGLALQYRARRLASTRAAIITNGGSP
ncbi:MAG: hypothetical protein FWG90_10490 [Oscillospiraceae bacterium]|nr:hypothetical protein [Oscillospiraceae bacterium]